MRKNRGSNGVLNHEIFSDGVNRPFFLSCGGDNHG
nr:MAG TPA: hypothetical protein [Caudoviricetes sp.]